MMLVAEAATPTSETLAFPDAAIVLGVAALIVLLSGVLVIWSRRKAGPAEGNTSTIRSWLAIALVAGLILFCAASLALSDSSMRSTLFGGLIASAGAASAFYFASSNSDQARKDILDASFGTAEVPDLKDKTLSEVHGIVARSAMALQVDPVDAPEDSTVAEQKPAAGTRARRGDSLLVTLTKPPSRDGSAGPVRAPEKTGEGNS